MGDSNNLIAHKQTWNVGLVDFKRIDQPNGLESIPFILIYKLTEQNKLITSNQLNFGNLLLIASDHLFCSVSL